MKTHMSSFVKPRLWCHLMSAQLKNPFGLKNGVLVTVHDVPPGLECGCTCPNCGAQFIARIGVTGRQPHFMHYNAPECGASYETAAHRMAKEILQESKAIMLPYLDLESSKAIQVAGTFRAKQRLVERQLFGFDDAELEVWMDGRVPDVVLTKRDRRLLVEIVVSHGITPEKLQWIRDGNHAVMRVNLTWANPTTLRSTLQQCLRTGFDPYGRNVMHWVHHPWARETQERLNQEYLKSVADGTVAKPSPQQVDDASTPTWSPPKRDRSLFD